jgi:hypothetical protein
LCSRIYRRIARTLASWKAALRGASLPPRGLDGGLGRGAQLKGVGAGPLGWHAAQMEELCASPELAAMVAREQAALEDRIRVSGLPLVALAEPTPSPRMLGDASTCDGVTESVGLAYGDPMAADGPLVQVHCARWPQSLLRPPQLRDLLEQELDRIGDRPVVGQAVEQAVLRIDGQPCPAAVPRASPRWWAARCSYRGAEVTVVARDWELVWTRLVSVADVEPFLRGRREYLAGLRAGPPAPPVPVEVEADVAGAHRALVEAVLAQARDAAARVGQGQPPRRRGTERLGGLWEAATRAQMRLADQSRQQANQAVTAMVNQLVGLQEEAAWFAEERLRGAAITETLLYWSGQSEAVWSRAAQQAWQQVWQLQRHQPPGGLLADEQQPPAEHADRLRRWVEQQHAARAVWLAAWEAWEAWARSQRP